MWFYMGPTLWLVFHEDPVALVWESHVSFFQVRCVQGCCRGDVVTTWQRDGGNPAGSECVSEMKYGGVAEGVVLRVVGRDWSISGDWGYLPPKTGGACP